jgi:hypothetical protein
LTSKAEKSKYQSNEGQDSDKRPVVEAEGIQDLEAVTICDHQGGPERTSMPAHAIRIPGDGDAVQRAQTRPPIRLLVARALQVNASAVILVPTEAKLARREGRSHDPASVLLACIQAERDAKQERKATQRVRARNRPKKELAQN